MGMFVTTVRDDEFVLNFDHQPAVCDLEIVCGLVLGAWNFTTNYLLTTIYSLAGHKAPPYPI